MTAKEYFEKHTPNSYDLFTEGTRELIYSIMEGYAASKQELSNKLIEALEEYQHILYNEMDETTPIAHNHGWRSKRFDEGLLARKKIADLKAEMEQIAKGE